MNFGLEYPLLEVFMTFVYTCRMSFPVMLLRGSDKIVEGTLKLYRLESLILVYFLVVRFQNR